VSETFSKCPKCGEKFPEPLPASANCPNCGLYFFKWQQPVRRPALDEESQHGAESLADTLLAPREQMGPMSFYGRICAWALLAIHEAGHVFFMPFGEFLAILGGSFLQLALPLGIGVAFILKNRDNFGAAVCLWWTGASLVDLSAYVYDSLHPQMLLLGGHTGEDGPHDWIYLLDALGQLRHAQGWGTFAHTLGGLTMLAGIIWGALVLKRQRRQLE
jgi:hypothetical protein